MLTVHSFYVEVKKHGTHDQKTHAGGRGGSSPMDSFRDATAWSTSNNFKMDYTENQAVKNAYESRYSKSTNEAKGTTEEYEELSAVEFYIGDGYETMNGRSRGKLENIDAPTGEYIDDFNMKVDSAIDKAPPIVGDKNLYRVYSDKVLADLQPGDKVVDKGFLSTTRVDLTGTALSSRNTRERLGDIRPSSDTVAVILPNQTKSGKGLIVDAYLPANGNVENGIWQREFEVLLPRNTELTFLGYQEGEMEKVAVFRRND